MTRWTTVPPWLYQNTLSDEELQTVYVTEARKKVAALRRQKREIEADLAEVDAALGPAEAFLAEAEAALRRYRTDIPARGRPQPRRLPAARLLPKP